MFIKEALFSPCDLLIPLTDDQLANDHHGLSITKSNVPTLRFYSDFEYCFVFPRIKAEDGAKFLRTDIVQEILLRICRARVGKSVSDLYRIDRLHPIYELSKADVRGCSVSELRCRLQQIFIRVLTQIGASVIESVGTDKHRYTFVRARLTEHGADFIADLKRYPLQIDRNRTKFDEFKNTPDFVPPFMLFDSKIEPIITASSKSAEPIWQRYDRVGTRTNLITPNEDLELSKYRDVDRIRLLRLALFEFMNVELMIREDYMVQAYPLKQVHYEDKLMQTWGSLKWIFSWNQPLDDIRDYFGEEIAMYFAWLGFYAKSLTVPAVVGVFIQTLSYFNDKADWLLWFRGAYCIFIALWATIFFARWRRLENILALRWGVEHARLPRFDNEENPFFQPDRYIVDPIHPNRFQRSYSPTKRKIRMILTATFMVVMTTLVVLLVNDDLMDMFTKLVWTGDNSTEHYGLERMLVNMIGGSAMAAHIGYIALATSLLAKMCDIFGSDMIVKRLGEFENHQSISDYNNSTNLKIFIFKVSSYFAMLYYLAFFKNSIHNRDEDPGSSLSELSTQLIMFYITDLCGALLEVVLPYLSVIRARWLAKPNRDEQPGYQMQSYLPQYIGFDGLTADFLQKVTQFGYTALFSMAVPWLPLLGLCVNMLELRTDAIKLCRVYQRPLPRQADTIGIWNDIQRIMSFLAVLSNVFLCCFAIGGSSQYSLMTQTTTCLVLSLMALALKDYIEFKLPGQSEEYDLLKTRMQIVDYETLWGSAKP